MTARLRLGVNIDHVATIRNARGGDHPDPVRAAEIVAAGADQEAHVVGLSILSGSHIPLISGTMERMRAAGLGAIVVGWL